MGSKENLSVKAGKQVQGKGMGNTAYAKGGKAGPGVKLNKDLGRGQSFASLRDYSSDNEAEAPGAKILFDKDSQLRSNSNMEVVSQ